MDKLDKLIIRMYDVGCFQFGKFVLTSGKESPYYIDLRRTISHPSIFKEMISLYEEELGIVGEYDVVVGIETGSIPIASVLSYRLGKPMIYVRKKRKEFGGGKLIEGVIMAGSKAVIIEDVVTTGGSIARAVEAVRESGSIVKHAIAFIDRLQGGKSRLGELGVELICITDVKKVFDILYKSGKIPSSAYNLVLNYVEAVKFEE